MRAYIENDVLYLYAADVPRYKKRGGSVVRNSYFWALRSIAARSPFEKPWEFESEVWFALNRMLLSFFESGYLGTQETQLEFLDGSEVPSELRGVSTWVSTFESDTLESNTDAQPAPQSSHPITSRRDPYYSLKTNAKANSTTKTFKPSVASPDESPFAIHSEKDLPEASLPPESHPDESQPTHNSARPRRSTRLG